MKSIKIVLAISAILGVALLNSAAASAAKYTVENVENNPDYKILKQRLVRMEIDEDEEIDVEELANHIFVGSSTKHEAGPLLKEITLNGLKVRRNLLLFLSSGKGSGGVIDKQQELTDHNNLIRYQNLQISKTPLLDDINYTVKYDKSIKSKNMGVTFRIPLGRLNGGIGLGINGQPVKNMSNYLQEYSNGSKDLYNSAIYLEKDIDIGWGFANMYVFENFELVINRKSTQPQDDKKDEGGAETDTEEKDISTEAKEQDSQGTLKTSAETTQEVTPSTSETELTSAPNTGFSSTSPIVILAGLAVTSTGFFLLKRR